MLSLRLRLIEIDHICRSVGEHNRVESDSASQVGVVASS